MKKKKRLSGIERRWFVNNVGVIMLLVAACVFGVVFSVAAYYDTNLRSGLENKAKTTTDFFSNYISQSYKEYYQSCIKFAQTFEEKDRLELQFISANGKLVASSYGKFAGRSASTPEIQQAIDSQQIRHYKGRNPLTGERILAVSSPMIYTNGEVIGVLRYVTSLRNADLQVLMIALIAVTVGLLFIGSIFFLSSFFIRSILVPVSQINATAKRIAAGSYGVQIPKLYDDEIGELADALVSMREELQKQEKTKEEMIHNISHDLKTPIATIKSYGESIKDGIYPYETLEKSVDVIIENADRLEAKVHSLLYMNRVEYLISQDNNGAVTNMKDVVEKVLLNIAVIKPDIRIETELEEITFEGLEESWRVVVENILENAQRYAQSVITIHLNEQEGLTIANDGPSMDESRIETLFKPFEKGEGGRFGLGLSIVAKVVRANHYEVRGENTADGVIFRIYRNQPKKAKQKTERRSRQRGAKNNNEA